MRASAAGCAPSPRRGRCTANAEAIWCWATALTDADGIRHEMTGLLGLETSFAKRRMHLGYRLAELASADAGSSGGCTPAWP